MLSSRALPSIKASTQGLGMGAWNWTQHTGPGDGGVALDSAHRAWGGGRGTGLSTCTVDCEALAPLQTIKRHVTLEHSQAGLTSHALPHHTSTPSHMCMTLYKRQEVLHTCNNTYTHIMHNIPSHLQRPHTLPQSNLNNYTQAPYTCTYSHTHTRTSTPSPNDTLTPPKVPAR